MTSWFLPAFNCNGRKSSRFSLCGCQFICLCFLVFPVTLNNFLWNRWERGRLTSGFSSFLRAAPLLGVPVEDRCPYPSSYPWPQGWGAPAQRRLLSRWHARIVQTLARTPAAQTQSQSAGWCFQIILTPFHWRSQSRLSLLHHYLSFKILDIFSILFIDVSSPAGSEAAQVRPTVLCRWCTGGWRWRILTVTGDLKSRNRSNVLSACKHAFYKMLKVEPVGVECPQSCKWRLQLWLLLRPEE